MIYCTPPFEKEWQGRPDIAIFSLKTTHFLSCAYSGLMIWVPFKWESPQELHPGPFPNMSVQWVCNSTEVKCSLSLFSFQEQWKMLFFFSFFLWLRKPTCLPHLLLQLDMNRDPVITPRFPVLTRGSKKLIKEIQKPQTPSGRAYSLRLHCTVTEFQQLCSHTLSAMGTCPRMILDLER